MIERQDYLVERRKKLKTPEFNLLDEKWIKVLQQDCSEKMVSLTEVLIYAHEYRDLCGDTPEQDIAVLRLLLAVLHTVFSRVDHEGQTNRIDSERTARKRWRTLWEKGYFKEEVIQSYLEQYRERFWLFHDLYPFWQIPEASIGTEYTVAKLNGELSESGNKTRLFPLRNGIKKQKMEYAEAARWLLYVNAYDDTSAKPKGKGLPSPGVGWLGKLGLIEAVGDNLFQTLMLNLTLLKDGISCWEGENKPIWECEPSKQERREITVPDNPAELLTVQSRRLLLKRDHDNVVGYYLLGGDFFDKNLAYAEQMTVWREVKEKDRKFFTPRRHDPSRQMWRDFGSIFVNKEDHIPGIVSWYDTVAVEMNWENQIIRFRIVSVQYGDKDFFVNDTFSDSLTFHGELILEKSAEWQLTIMEEIRKCEEVGEAIGSLEENLARAEGRKADIIGAKAQWYNRIDQPFRKWLMEISPKTKEEEESKKIEEIIKKIGKELGREMFSGTGPTAFVGRNVIGDDKKKNEKDQYFASPKAYNWFLGKLHKIYH